MMRESEGARGAAISVHLGSGALTTTIKPRGFVGTPSGVLRNV